MTGIIFITAGVIVGIIIGYNVKNKELMPNNKKPDGVHVGQVRYMENKDPFSKGRIVVTVLDIKDGFVKYRQHSGPYEWSMDIGSFVGCYKNVMEPEQAISKQKNMPVEVTS